jgi:hypothetical protein
MSRQNYLQMDLVTFALVVLMASSIHIKGKTIWRIFGMFHDYRKPLSKADLYVRPETVAEIWMQHTRHGVVCAVWRSHGGDHGRTIYPSGGGRCFSLTFVIFYQSTRRHIPKDSNLHANDTVVANTYKCSNRLPNTPFLSVCVASL